MGTRGHEHKGTGGQGTQGQHGDKGTQGDKGSRPGKAPFCFPSGDVAEQRSEAAAMGTFMHARIKSLLNGDVVPLEGLEMQLFRDLLRVDAPKLLAYRTEWCVYAEEERLAGSIDFVAPAENGEAWYSSIGNVAGT